VTKSFTGAAIMLLDQRGKLHIDDKITDTIPGSTEPYIPATAAYNIPNKSQITIRLLLEHRAGVFDVANSDIPSTESAPYAGQIYIDYVKASEPTHEFTCDELTGVVATYQLKYFAPDASQHYSDTGYGLLGKIIERVSGQRYDQFVRDNLLTPNGLTETTFPCCGDDRTIPAPYETGYGYNNGTLMDATVDNMSAHVAEGNVISTPRELATWIKALISGRAGLSTATVAKMTAVLTTESGGNYGLGVFHVSGLGYGHNGGHNGYMTAAFYDPTQEVAVVAFFSVLDWNDIIGEMLALYDTGRAAKNVLGYSTAEAD
jgi:D-alanyl-D-alanine carboxypeptidase